MRCLQCWWLNEEGDRFGPDDQQLVGLVFLLDFPSCMRPCGRGAGALTGEGGTNSGSKDYDNCLLRKQLEPKSTRHSTLGTYMVVEIMSIGKHDYCQSQIGVMRKQVASFATKI